MNREWEAYITAHELDKALIMSLSSRKDNVHQAPFLSWGLMISKIDAALDTIRTAFSASFSERDQSVQEGSQHYHKKKIFDDLWQFLADGFKHLNVVSEFDQFAAEAKLLLQEKVIFSHDASGLSEVKKEMLICLIDVHLHLAKNRFMLSQLTDDDVLPQFLRRIQDLADLHAAIEGRSHSLDSKHINLLANSAWQAASAAEHRLAELGYLRMTSGLSRWRFNFDDYLAQSIKTQVDQLASAQQLQTWITESLSDDRQISAQAHVKLEDALAKLRAIKASLSGLFNTAVTTREQDYLHYRDIICKIAELFAELEQYSHFGLVLDNLCLLRAEREYRAAAEAVQACAKKQSTSAVYTAGYYDRGGWYEAGKTAYSLMNELIEEQVKVISPYFDSFKDIDAICTKLKVLHENCISLEDMRASFERTVIKANQSTALSLQGLTRMEEILAQHLQTNWQALRAFIAKHWGKMTLGGALSGGGSAAAAIVFDAHAWALTVFVAAGTAIGVSVGSGVGAGVDKCRTRQDADIDIERQPLLAENAQQDISNVIIPYRPIVQGSLADRVQNLLDNGATTSIIGGLVSWVGVFSSNKTAGAQGMDAASTLQLKK